MMEWRYSESSLEGIIEIKLFATKKEARDYLNQRVKEFKESNKEWSTYYTDNSKYYSIKDLRLKADIEAEDKDEKDLGESDVPYRYYEIDFIGE